MSVFGWIKWRVTRARVRKSAVELLELFGEQAFFACHEEAWRAQGEGDQWKARYKRHVCAEIAREMQRRAIVRSIMAPPWQRRGHAASPESRALGCEPRGHRLGRRGIPAAI